jgi:site-specific DNA recombinase
VDNHATMRCAIYARYSSDNQREASIQDQIRKCREYADSKLWMVLEDHIYTDEAISGSGSDRPSLMRMLELAYKNGKVPFDVILVDDTSRLSRNLADVIRMTEQLTFRGIRVVAISQGIDSADEQAPVMFTVHGLIDQFYIREQAKKTHRGLEGLALQGMHTGGRVFGYRAIDAIDDRKQLEINEEQAKIIRRIFEMRAKGMSLKKITKKLNDDHVPSPRPGTRKKYDTWCPTAVREMLKRELYIGIVVWNKRKYVKNPGTNKRVSRPRPQSDWKYSQRPDLRIVSDELWAAVQKKNDATMAMYSEGAKKGLANRIESSEYLLSGLLKCGLCGANLVIISGRGGKWARYGCSQHWNRGCCKNDLTVNRQLAEQTLLGDLDRAVNKNEAMEFVFEELRKMLVSALNEGPDSGKELQGRKAQVEAELDRLTAAIRQGVPAKTLRKALAEGERELAQLSAKLEEIKPIDIDVHIDAMRKFAIAKIASLPVLFRQEPAAARWELRKRMGDIWMTPVRNAEGDRQYIGVGKWSLVDDDYMSSLRGLLDDLETRQKTGVRCVASINSSSIRALSVDQQFWSDIEESQELQREWDSTCPGFMKWLQNRNATGAWLNCGVQSVAGAGFEPATFGL